MSDRLINDDFAIGIAALALIVAILTAIAMWPTESEKQLDHPQADIERKSNE